MDRIWSPWRYRYVSGAEPAGDCIFCEKIAENRDEANFIVHRAAWNFVILNLYPYTSGHLMVVPYEHVATLEQANPATLAEMIELTRAAEAHLRALYRPKGFNLGMNIGESAGAGIAGHIHMHVVPRWPADSNFMTTVGETRVLPEDLPSTYAKLRSAWGS
jgi:ATP adenylyltransferase